MDCEFLSRRRTSQIVDTLFEILKDALTRGEDVMIRGFGKFQVKFRWARTWMNPRTGEKIILPSRRSVTFKASPVLRRKLNPPP
ncbi:MAG: HU family DNA-binding protein, partial [Deltaproteobacteria bacterium]|nr:HU family DNA-binding protein [Deltaproteobacteria bacterium]MBW2349195.1 HU family DNA-binding protein [Deltaproteobacteria bacterium]